MTSTRPRLLAAAFLSAVVLITVLVIQSDQLRDPDAQVLGAKVQKADKPEKDEKAEKKGPFVDASCDIDGVTVSYDAGYTATDPAGYKVEKATIGDIAATCTGVDVTVELLGGTEGLAKATVEDVSDAVIDVPFDVPPPAQDVTNVSVTIAGGTTPVPDECRTMVFEHFRSLTAGPDTLTASKGNDLVYGLAGDDILRGDNKDDCLVGQGDDDQLFGGNNNDVLLGGEGDDLLDGGPGHDICVGGRGTNRFLNCEDQR